MRKKLLFIWLVLHIGHLQCNIKKPSISWKQIARQEKKKLNDNKETWWKTNTRKYVSERHPTLTEFGSQTDQDQISALPIIAGPLYPRLWNTKIQRVNNGTCVSLGFDILSEPWNQSVVDTKAWLDWLWSLASYFTSLIWFPPLQNRWW